MLSNTGSTESVVKYVVYRRRQPAGNLVVITAILFYWITLKVVQQLTGLIGWYSGPAYVRQVSCWT